MDEVTPGDPSLALVFDPARAERAGQLYGIPGPVKEIGKGSLC
jgi:hypothetical protein